MSRRSVHKLEAERKNDLRYVDAHEDEFGGHAEIMSSVRFWKDEWEALDCENLDANGNDGEDGKSSSSGSGSGESDRGGDDDGGDGSVDGERAGMNKNKKKKLGWLAKTISNFELEDPETDEDEDDAAKP